MGKTVVVIVVIGLCACGISGNQKKDNPLYYSNPLMDGELRMGDPFVLRHNDLYFLYGTNAASEGFKAWMSTDLVHWDSLGWVYRKSASDSLRSSFWAPEVHYHPLDHKFYLIYSSKESRGADMDLCIASSDHPGGPFTDVARPWVPIEGWQRIDAHLFFDDSIPYLFFDKVGVVGKPWEKPSTGYMYGKIYVAELSPDLLHMVNEPILCLEAEQPWEHPQSMHSRCNEGSFVFKRDDRYYMTYSANHYADPSYAIGYASSSTPVGPWVKPLEEPILKSDTTMGFSGPGHSSLVPSPDSSEWFIVYHAHTDWKNPSGDRQVYIDRIDFSKGELSVAGPTLEPQEVPR